MDTDKNTIFYYLKLAFATIFLVIFTIVSGYIMVKYINNVNNSFKPLTPDEICQQYSARSMSYTQLKYCQKTYGVLLER